eukprot:2688955-Prymnesium_polylepis.1
MLDLAYLRRDRRPGRGRGCREPDGPICPSFYFQRFRDRLHRNDGRVACGAHEVCMSTIFSLVAPRIPTMFRNEWRRSSRARIHVLATAGNVMSYSLGAAGYGRCVCLCKGCPARPAPHGRRADTRTS